MIQNLNIYMETSHIHIGQRHTQFGAGNTRQGSLQDQRQSSGSSLKWNLVCMKAETQ